MAGGQVVGVGLHRGQRHVGGQQVGEPGQPQPPALRTGERALDLRQVAGGGGPAGGWGGGKGCRETSGNAVKCV